MHPSFPDAGAVERVDVDEVSPPARPVAVTPWVRFAPMTGELQAAIRVIIPVHQALRNVHPLPGRTRRPGRGRDGEVRHELR